MGVAVSGAFLRAGVESLLLCGAREEFFEEQAGEASRIVADDAVLFKEIVEDHAIAQLMHFGQIDGHRQGALPVAPFCHL